MITGSNGHICPQLEKLLPGLWTLNANMWISKMGDNWYLLTKINEEIGDFRIVLNFCPFCGECLTEDEEDEEDGD